MRALPTRRGFLLGTPAAVSAADAGRFESSVLDNLERRAREALAAIPRARTIEEAARARPGLRRKLETSLGFRRLPFPPSLEPRTAGVVAREGYRVEKIVYQTLPGVEVPAHFYVPDALNAPAPAILFYTGHWWADSKARPDFQAFCINVARLGFVVLAFDAFGQGERGISNRDHRRVEALVGGISQQGFAEHETQCALHYLLSRQEVDPKRIGMTGASGGGYNTWITAALDDRVAVAVPVVGTSEFYGQIKVCRPLDWYRANEHCHFVAGLIRYANNHELLAMIAPRPLLIIAASQDQSFPIEGVREVGEYGRALYQTAGAPERIGLFEDSSAGHGYQQKKREAAYGWFLRWLAGRGDGSPVPEPPTQTPPWDSPELRCFPPGKNKPAGPGMIAAVERIAAALPARQRPVLPALPSHPAFRATHPERSLIPVESDLQVPALFTKPAGRIAGLLVASDDRGKEQLASDPLVREAIEGGWAVCAVDPRGIGEMATRLEGWVAAVSLLLDEPFVWRQAWDLSCALEYFRSAPELGRVPSALYGRGDNAALAATLALAQPPARRGLGWFALRDGFITFRHFLDRPKSLTSSYALLTEKEFRTATYDREIPFKYFVFDAWRRFDLPELMAGAGARGLVINPIDGDWNPLDARQARRLLPRNVTISTGAAGEVTRLMQEP